MKTAFLRHIFLNFQCFRGCVCVVRKQGKQEGRGGRVTQTPETIEILKFYFVGGIENLPENE
jgi:hypothetical protein